MNQSLTVYERMPDPLQAIQQLGLIIAKSGMFGADTEAKGQIIALTCFTERISPVEFQKRYHLVEGKLAMRADRMLADFRSAGGKCQWLSDVQSTEEALACFSYKENERVSLKYTIRDAEREGLTAKKVWQKSAPDMLRARLISKAIRMLAPEIISGAYTPEEIAAECADGNTVAVEATPAPLAPLLPTEPEAKPAELKIADAACVPGGAPAYMAGLQNACSDLEPGVNKFLQAKGWIEEGQTWRNLALQHVEAILARSDSFREKVKEFTK